MEEFFKPYRSMYVDMKLPEIATIQQDRYDRAKEEKTALDRALGRMQLNDPGDVHRNRLKKEIEGLIGSRPDFENLQSIITDVTTKVMSDQPLLRALDTWEAREKEKEIINKLIAEGNQVLDFGDAYKKDADGKLIRDANGKPIRDHVFQKWDTEEKGVYRQHAEQRLPWEVTAQQLMQGIAEDPIKLARLVASGDLDKETADLFLKYGTVVSRAKVAKVANALAEEYMQTSAGRQQFRTLTSLEINPETNELYTPEEAKKTIADYLYGIGSKQEGAKLSYTEDPLAMAKAKAALETPEAPQLPHFDETLFGNPNKENELAEALKTQSGASKWGDLVKPKGQKSSAEEELKKTPLGAWTPEMVSKHSKGLVNLFNSDPKISKLKKPMESETAFAERYLRILTAASVESSLPITTGTAASTARENFTALANSSLQNFRYGASGPLTLEKVISLIDAVDDSGWIPQTEGSQKTDLIEAVKNGTAPIAFVRTGSHAGEWRINHKGHSVYYTQVSQQTRGFELVRAAGQAVEKADPEGTVALTKEEMDATASFLEAMKGDGTKSVLRNYEAVRVVSAINSQGKKAARLEVKDSKGWSPVEGYTEETPWVSGLSDKVMGIKMSTDTRTFGPLQAQYPERSNVTSSKQFSEPTAE